MHSHHIPALLHYLDDFITAGPPDSPQCAHNLAVALAVCKRLGLPLHPGKCVGPATVLVVLGIELDSVSQIARLPAEKLSALKDLISSWLPRKCCNRRELESLIGHLHHAAKVVWPGNKEFHLDLRWWHQFLSQWHGVSFWLFPGLSPEADVEVSSDAAGSLGYGAFFKDCRFAGPWEPSQQQQSIAYKELFPVVIAAHVWGHHLLPFWRGLCSTPP